MALMVITSGLTLAQRGHRLSIDSTKWHPRADRHFDLGDSCWKVFLSDLPADTAQMLTGAIDNRRDVEVKVDSLQKDLRAARRAKDTVLMHAIWAQIKDDFGKMRDDRKQIDSIIDKYHKVLVEVRRTCDNDGKKGTIGLKVTPIVPNPATTKAHFSYTINADEDVLIQIFDQGGNVVKTIFNAHADQGEHDVQLDLSGLKSGVYLLRIQAGPDVNTLKLVIAGKN